MNKRFDTTVAFLPGVTLPQTALPSEPKQLPGLYSWLRFGAYFTRDDWVESFGIDLTRICEKAAITYLDGEAAFFKNFTEECVAAIGMPRLAALRQAKLEGIRRSFIEPTTRICGSPIEQIVRRQII